MDKLYMLWLLQVSEQQFVSRNYKLIKRYASGKDIYEACAGALDSSVFSEKDRAVLSCRSLDKAKRLLDECEQKHIGIVSYYDSDYPSYLREIATPPAVLFVKGTLPNTCENPAITIIGTRHCSDEGRKNAAKFAYTLSKFGFTVVSGLARGIDTYAHKGCLLADASPTVAVLAGGVDKIYPPENKELYEMIASHGAVISEAIPGTDPIRAFFPIRNRILSGLTYSTLVVETAAKGGSLITAACALDQNRTVFAIPGSLNAVTSKGTNALIKDGAVFCSGVSVIVEEYYSIYKDKIKVTEKEELEKEIAQNKKERKKKIEGLEENEQELFELLGSGEMSADELSEKTGKPINELIGVLQLMELKGFIKAVKGGKYIINV